MKPGFKSEKSSGRESETYKNGDPLLLGDGPAPCRCQSTGARDPQGAFKSRSRLSRNGEETPPYGRREGASCDSPNGQIKQTKVLGGHPVLVTAVEETLKNWKYAPASAETTTQLEFSFHP